MAIGEGLNEAARHVLQSMLARKQDLRIGSHKSECGATILDCGVETPGGLAAGLELAEICLAGKAKVQVVPGDRSVWPGPWIQVASDWPVEACMLGQYAGWPVKKDKFFAMGSGPMRIQRGKEAVLESLAAQDNSTVAVGTLECDCLPPPEVLEMMAKECGLAAENLLVAVAPTRSLAGCVQVVARSVETSLHKLHELGFPLKSVQSAYGIAPLPTPTPDFGLGIGRTNDAILYGGHVTLWVSCEDALIAELGPRLPSSASPDYGRPFAEIFKACGYDFYKVDPGLFSPAEVTLVNLASGNSWRFGKLRADLLQDSFSICVAS